MLDMLLKSMLPQIDMDKLTEDTKRFVELLVTNVNRINQRADDNHAVLTNILACLERIQLPTLNQPEGKDNGTANNSDRDVGTGYGNIADAINRNGDGGIDGLADRNDSRSDC